MPARIDINCTINAEQIYFKCIIQPTAAYYPITKISTGPTFLEAVKNL